MSSDHGLTNSSTERFAQDDDEAARRYKEFKRVDPFPTIPPALLNSADIQDYVAATGMICPFYSTKDYLKPSSYGVRLRGKCVYWSKNGKRRFILSKEIVPQYRNIDHVEEFTLERNSIAFVSLEPMFRIPEYIAFRFNLKIKQVYRGMLLGTGPLVDPGFENRLSFPLHNLTNEEYVLRAGEDIIYMEFTKISPIPKWKGDGSPKGRITRQGNYVPFSERKLERKDLDDYLFHANEGRPVQSSIPVEVEKASKAARQVGSIVFYGALGVGITIIAMVATIIYQGFALLGDATTVSGNLKAEFSEFRVRTQATLNQTERLLESVQRANALNDIGLRALKDEIEKLLNERQADEAHISKERDLGDQGPSE